MECSAREIRVVNAACLSRRDNALAHPRRVDVQQHSQFTFAGGRHLKPDGQFARDVERLTGHPPMPWQAELFARFVEREVPASCDIPVDGSATSVIAVWLLALGHHARGGLLTDFPRRLLYVVHRSAMLDHAFAHANGLCAALALPDLAPLARRLREVAVPSTDERAPIAVATLRDPPADESEWRRDPARPAILVGTSDAIRRRLLLSGMAGGRLSGPVDAGLLCRDTLLLYDAAHPDPALHEILDAIHLEQEHSQGLPRMRVMTLTQTPSVATALDVADFRSDQEQPPRTAADDRSHDEISGDALRRHLQASGYFAATIAGRVGLPGPLNLAVRLAAEWHHLQIERIPLFQELPPDQQDLVLHLVAAHHRRAPPASAEGKALDPSASDESTARIAHEVSARALRLQPRFGRWGLAWLASLVTAAEMLAWQKAQESQRPRESPALLRWSAIFADDDG